MSASESNSFYQASHQELMASGPKLGAITKGLFVEDELQEYVVNDLQNLQQEKVKSKTEVEEAQIIEDQFQNFNSFRHNRRKKTKQEENDKKISPQKECEPVQISFPKQQNTLSNPEIKQSQKIQAVDELAMKEKKQKETNQKKTSILFEFNNSQNSHENVEEIKTQEKINNHMIIDQTSRQNQEINELQVGSESDKKSEHLYEENQQKNEENGKKQAVKQEQIDERQLQSPLIRAFQFLPPSRKAVYIFKRDQMWLNKIHPVFHVYNLRNQYFMSVKLSSNNATLTFIASINPKSFSENSDSYVGKLKSNFIGNIINIYGPGYNPSNVKKKMKKPRELLATVAYDTNFFGSPKPRNFTVYTLKRQVSYNNNLYGVKLGQEQIPLNELYKNPANQYNMKVFQSKTPEWNSDYKAYVLNFKGRVKQASIKNFILEDLEKEGEDERQSLVFGKVSDDQFRLDIQTEINPFVGIGIAMSTFGSKIGCQ